MKKKLNNMEKLVVLFDDLESVHALIDEGIDALISVNNQLSLKKLEKLIKNYENIIKQIRKTTDNYNSWFGEEKPFRLVSSLSGNNRVYFENFKVSLYINFEIVEKVKRIIKLWKFLLSS